MSRRRSVGGGGARNPASLGNLKRGGTVAPLGNQRALKHGAYSEALLADVSAEVRELMDALGAVVPVRDPDGQVPASDLPGLEAAAVALRRYRKVSAWCDLHGRLGADGAVTGAANLELDAERAYWRALGAFGLHPQAKAKLGDVLTRTASVAQAMSEPDAARRRRMLAEAGVELDDHDEEEGR